MIKSFLDPDSEPEPQATGRPAKKEVIGLFDADGEAELVSTEKESYILSSAQPESVAETARKSGLAWSMGVVFFSAVVFMLVLGWGADLLFGSSPWGIVAGIVIGALIGFVQLFRLSSQIFNK